VTDELLQEDDVRAEKRLAERRVAWREQRRARNAAGPMSPERRRWPTVAGVVAVLVLAGWGSTTLKPAAARTFVATAALDSGMPVVIPPGVRSTQWFCPGPLPIGSAVYSASIELSNTGATAVAGRATIVSAAGWSATGALTVPAQGRTSVPVTGSPQRSSAAVAVELSGGGVGAEEVVHASGETTTAPCQVQAFAHWYFASGSTAAGSDLLLALYNPGATATVTNVSFSAGSPPVAVSAGEDRASAQSSPAAIPITPASLQGLVVNPGKLVVIDVGQSVQLRPELATTVVADGGRIVAGEWSQPIAGLTATGPASGAGAHKTELDGALIAGTDQTLDRWWFPLGGTPGGAADAYWIYNPSGSATKVSLSASLGAQTTATLQFVVAAGSLATVLPPLPSRPKGGVVSAAQEVAAGQFTASDWVEVSSQQKPGIVVARSAATTLPSQSRARGGVPRVVISPDSLLGASMLGREWLFSGTVATAGRDELVTLADPGSHAVVVSIAMLGSLAVPGALALPGVLPVTKLRGIAPLVRGATHGPSGIASSGTGFVAIEIITVPAGGVV
jgi:hypothetical protein